MMYTSIILLQYQEFLNAMLEGGVELSEPDVVLPHYEPGIDFDDQYEVNSFPGVAVHRG